MRLGSVTRTFAFALLAGAMTWTGCGRTSLDFGDLDDTGETTVVTDESTDTGDETDTGWDESTDDGSFIPDDTDTDDTGVEPKSCRDMLECVFGCVANLDPSCFAMCGEGADPAELQAAVGLITCLGGICIENGECSIPDFAAESCIGCIGLGLFLPQPPGCEDAAAACM